MESSKPHIVVVPVAIEGHLTPMMHLCVFLAKRGFSITFAVMCKRPSNAYERLKLKGSWPPPGLDICLKQLDTDVPFPEQGLSDLAVSQTHGRTYQGHLEQIVQELMPNVACIISDYLLGWCLDVAHKYGIPGVLLFTGSAAWSWFELQMPQLCSAELVPMQPQGEEIAVGENTVVLNNPFNLQRSDIPWHFWNAKSWQDYTVKYLSDGFKRCAWTLINSCSELEGDIVKIMQDEIGPKFIPVGPLFLLHGGDASYAGLQKSDSECLQWLDNQPPDSVLYIAFGSLATISAEQMEEIASGLEASKHKFLWVIRDSQEFLQKVSERIDKEQGVVVTWSPQTQVLSHPAVCGFLSHCGWNSTLDGLSNGNSILCWPMLYDQNINSKFIVEKWKAGAKFSTNRSKGIVERTEVERVIRLLMESEEGKEMRNTAKQIGQGMRKCIRDGDSRNNLEAFVQDISKREFLSKMK